jgi:ATP-dependent Clp protease ATP-binding subunit ClpA
MRLLHRRRPGPRTKTARPAAEPYLAAGAAEARRRGDNYVGTEHVLVTLIRNPDGGATAVLRQLGVGTDAVEKTLASWLGTSKPRIDPEALAALGIDFEAVRERLEETFGPARSNKPAPAASASVRG